MMTLRSRLCTPQAPMPSRYTTSTEHTTKRHELFRRLTTAETTHIFVECFPYNGLSRTKIDGRLNDVLTEQRSTYADTREKYMITLNAFHARGTPRRVHAQSSCKWAIVMTPLLGIPLLLTYMPVTTTTELAFINNQLASISHPFNPCGDRPGICPNSLSPHLD